MQREVRLVLAQLLYQNPISSWLTRLVDRRLQAAITADAQNIERVRLRRALEDTVDFIEARLPATPSFPHRWALIEYALGQIRVVEPGLYCEFGVWTGSSINFLASRISADIFGFDSFEGLPEKWRDQLDQGAFRVARLPKVKSNVHLIQGWFEETLPGFLAQYPEPVTLMHIDCDLYSSTQTVLHLLRDRIQPGCVIVFDEYFNYPGWRQGEFKAFDEFVLSANIQYEYLGYCRYAQQVAIRII